VFGTQLLDVAIGLAFTYTILSLLTSAAVEVLEAALRTRGKYLWQGIGELVQDPAKLPRLGWRPRPKGEEAQPDKAPVKDLGVATLPGSDTPGGIITLSDVYRHPLIGGLYYGKYEQATGRLLSRKLPSYIPRGNFAAAVIDLVSRSTRGKDVSTIESVRRGVEGLADSSLRRALSALLAISGDDLSALQRALEAWYDSAMDRVSGWYKRHAQVMLLILGFAVAFTLNADSIALIRHLVVDEPARDALVEAAGEFVAVHQGTGLPSTMKDLQGYVKEIEGKAGPIGMTAPDRGLLAYAGYLLTTLAISLGASFWFDLLNKVMVIRSTVKPKEKSGDEGSEDRQAASPPGATARPTSFVMRP
jgi:uncharacterized membrane protein